METPRLPMSSGIRLVPNGCHIAPITKNALDRYINTTHRHLRAPNGWLFGVALLDSQDAILGVACAARPNARMLQDGVTCEITRVAVPEGGLANACSALCGALMRAAKALGYTRICTYTRSDEAGITPRAAGFVFDGVAGSGEWDRPSRYRGQATDPSVKHRWVWPASAQREQIKRGTD